MLTPICSGDFPAFDAAGDGGEVDSDEEDLSGIPGEAAGVALLLDLTEGLGGTSVVFQLDDVDVFRRLDEEVDASIGGVGLRPGVDSDEGREDVECVVEIILVVHLQVIRHPGEISVEATHHLLGLPVINGVHKLLDNAFGRDMILSEIEFQQIVEEPILHLVVGYLQTHGIVAYVIVAHGEIARLIQEGGRIGIAQVETGEPVEPPPGVQGFLKIDTGVAEYPGDKRGWPDRIPIHSDPTFLHTTQQRPGIIDIATLGSEPITVVILFKQLHRLVVYCPSLGGQSLYSILEIIMQLHLRYSADIGVGVVEGDVVEVVEVGEYAEFAEAADACQEDEAEMLRRALEIGIDGGQTGAVVLVIVILVDVEREGLVIFVDKDDYLLPRLLVGSLDDGTEPLRESGRDIGDSIFIFPFLEMLVKQRFEHPRFSEPVGVQVEIEYRVRLPVPVGGVDEEAPEKVVLSFEEIAQGREEEAFAEASRTGKEIILASFNEGMDETSLVDIQKSSFPDFLEVLLANRIFYLFPCHISLFFLQI